MKGFELKWAYILFSSCCSLVNAARYHHATVASLFAKEEEHGFGRGHFLFLPR